VAVLVFRAPPQAAAVAEALSEDLSTALMRSGMQVAAQSSVASLGAEVTPLAAGQRLNVDAVFAGSIRILGPQVRIHVELVDTKNAFQIWSDTFTLARQAALAGEQSVAGEVVNRMHAALAARE
jgi:TolB-like protein